MKSLCGILILPLVLVTAVMLSPDCSAQVRQYGVRVINRYPHDVTSYTQGLFIADGQMYESTGTYGGSTFRKVDIGTGKALRRLDFSRKYFVEGSVVFGDRLYILTWTDGLCFVYELDGLRYLGQFHYPRQGWGLATDGTSLIASEGTSYVYFIDPEDFSTERSIQVVLNGRPVDYINELEYIDGKIWANVYMTENILIIDPASGKVEGVVDCSGLHVKGDRSMRDDVFNGIAYNAVDGSVYVTGKYWRYLYKIELEEK